jgi:hypothetical protein
MRALHDARAARLAATLDASGWSGESRVGPDGAEAAWLIAQHSIAQPELQRRAPERAVLQREAPARRAPAARLVRQTARDRGLVPSGGLAQLT